MRQHSATPAVKPGRRAFLGSAFAAASFLGPSFGSLRAAQAAGRLRAGAATTNITPSLGSSMAGGMADRKAGEVHDELLVRGLVLDDGSTVLAFAVVDSCAVPREVIDRAKSLITAATGIPTPQILVSATHTHSAPPAAHLFQSPPDPKYQEWLGVRISDSVRLAFARREPARIGWGVGREERLVFNRRHFMKPGTIPPDPFGRSTDKVQMNPPPASPNIIKPAGPTDPDVGVIAVEATDGRPIALLGSYALHYVGGGGGDHITSDYFGAWARAITRLAGIDNNRRFPPFVPILTNACSGDINGINFTRPRVNREPYEMMERYAEILAGECYRTWRAMDMQDAVQLGASIEELELNVRRPSAEDLAAARKLLESASKDANGNYQDRRHIYARETVLLSEQFPRSVKTFVQAIRIGDLGIATFPGEAFVQLGLEVKAKSPFKPTMLIELANDYRGYIPTVEGHELGGYETWRAKSSYLEVQAAPKMVASALRQLNKLK